MRNMGSLCRGSAAFAMALQVEWARGQFKNSGSLERRDMNDLRCFACACLFVLFVLGCVSGVAASSARQLRGGAGERWRRGSARNVSVQVRGHGLRQSHTGLPEEHSRNQGQRRIGRARGRERQRHPPWSASRYLLSDDLHAVQQPTDCLGTGCTTQGRNQPHYAEFAECNADELNGSV